MLDLKNAPESVKNAISDSDFRVFVNASDDDSEPAELLIMEQIGEDWYGDGVSAKDVVAFVADNKGREINVRINSPGGLVYDGFVIYNALANHDAKVVVTVEGLAYSAASFIAMAGDVIRMHEASDIGIHRASAVQWGNAKSMRGTAEWLDTIDEHLLDILANRSGQTRDQINEWLDGTDDGTLFSAKEAVEHGFADEVIPGKKRQDNRVETVKKNAMKNMATVHRNSVNRMVKKHRSRKSS